LFNVLRVEIVPRNKSRESSCSSRVTLIDGEEFDVIRVSAGPKVEDVGYETLGAVDPRVLEKIVQLFAGFANEGPAPLGFLFTPSLSD